MHLIIRQEIIFRVFRSTLRNNVLHDLIRHCSPSNYFTTMVVGGFGRSSADQTPTTIKWDSSRLSTAYDTNSISQQTLIATVYRTKQSRCYDPTLMLCVNAVFPQETYDGKRPYSPAGATDLTTDMPELCKNTSNNTVKCLSLYSSYNSPAGVGRFFRCISAN